MPSPWAVVRRFCPLCLLLTTAVCSGDFLTTICRGPWPYHCSYTAAYQVCVVPGDFCPGAGRVLSAILGEVQDVLLTCCYLKVWGFSFPDFTVFRSHFVSLFTLHASPAFPLMTNCSGRE